MKGLRCQGSGVRGQKPRIQDLKPKTHRFSILQAKDSALTVLVTEVGRLLSGLINKLEDLVQSA
jgi:hypothetical protein